MMTKCKKILHEIAFPKKPFGLILGVLFLLFVGAVFLFRLDGTPISYVAYLLSAYGLYLVIMETLVPLVKYIKALLCRNPYAERYFSDKEFKARVSLYRGLGINVCYALFKLTAGIFFRSFWLIAIAFYYIALCDMKFILVRNDYRTVKGYECESVRLREWKAYRLTGYLMLFLNIAVSGIMIQVIWHDQSYSYAGFMIFAMAAYAFYNIIMSVVTLIRGRKNRGVIFSAAKSINLTVAVMSMFTLQTAMLSTFGNDDSRAIATANFISGIVTLIVVLGMAIFMIINGQSHINQERKALRHE